MRPSKWLLVVAGVLSITAGVYIAWQSDLLSSTKALLDAAAREGKLVVYATTDNNLAIPVVREFERAYPGVHVDYRHMNSSVLYRRYLKESASGESLADVLWSSSMDLQVKLINDGYALSYRSPAIADLPGWAHWREEAYGTTFEPMAIVYNKRLLADHDLPQTHADLLELLKKHPRKYRGKITTYDVERSGLGYMLATQDSKLNPDYWDFVRTLKASHVRLHSSTETMMERISSGDYLIGYNLIGSYALARARTDHAIGVILTKDYTLVISRLLFISKTARDPAAAKLWVDFLLSMRGQALLAEIAEFHSVRTDVNGKTSGTALSKQLGNSIRPIVVGPGLLAYLDKSKHGAFLKKWRQAIGRE